MSTQGSDLSESRANVILGVVWAFVGVATVTTALRFYTRIHIVQDVRRDDWFLLIAVIVSLANAGATTARTHYGLGSHFETLYPGEFIMFLKLLWVCVITYHSSLAFTKLSILLGYIRIFLHPRVYLASKVTIGLVVAHWLYGLLFTMLTCHPISFFWDPSIEGGDCIVDRRWYLSHAALNIATDVVIIAIPMPVLSSLHLARKAKLWLISVFAFGTFVLLISIIRIPSLIYFSNSTDITWDDVSTASWTAVEVNVGIVCASLPSLRAFLLRHFPNLVSTDVHRAPADLPSYSTTLSSGETSKREDSDASKSG